jgi:hypothetical protein
MKRDAPDGIDERTFRFFCDVLTYLESVPVTPRTARLIEQLLCLTLLDEARQLTRILAQIVISTKRNGT